MLSTGLHLVFLVTPPATTIAVNWTAYEDILHRLSKVAPSLSPYLPPSAPLETTVPRPMAPVDLVRF